MTASVRDLMQEARRLSVSVRLVHIDDENRFGEYNHDTREVIVDLGLTQVQIKETLAHELAHAHYGHTCSLPEHERRADRRAARLLIDDLEYVAAEAMDPEPSAIAAELGVTTRMVQVFQREWLACRPLRVVS